jgi:uncharacterized membrane protein YcaP (DUF421 family)
MQFVVRAAAVYLLLLLVIRLTGKRSLAQLTAFDFLLLLMIGEATQPAFLGNDVSLTGFALVVVTLVALNRVSDFVAWRWPPVDRVLNDSAVLLVEHGTPDEESLDRYRITRHEILEQARSSQALERMDQIKYAVLERTGTISIIPESAQ